MRKGTDSEKRPAADAILADRLLALLERGRSEHACAAALVLGALRPKDPRVGPALARRLRSARSPIRPYVREALARQRTDEALAILVEGLLATGVEREQSTRLVAAFGARALPHFDRVLARHRDEVGRQFFAIAAGFRTRAAVVWMMKHLGLANAPRAHAIERVLHEELMMGSWTRGLRKSLRAAALEQIRGGRFESAAGVRATFKLLRMLP